MKKLKITYNPFKLTTDILVDGTAPKPNSQLRFRKLRLQEWAEKLPKILIDELKERKYEITFVGTTNDFSDLRSILDENSEIKCEFTHIEKPSMTQVEKEVLSIFADIEKGPNSGPLKGLSDDKAIKNAFEDARNQEFEVNVVATMSSGKSTLINALLGKEIMPAAQKGTTSKIVRIIHTNQPNYHAFAYDSSGELIKENKNISGAEMKEWNRDQSISSVDLYCPIPCVNSVGMRLVIIDTPGPNNALDPRHREVTFEMLKSSPKSLVLFVINKNQSGVSDEASLINHVAEVMAEGGKLSRERFIFAVNQMDTCRPGQDDIEKDLTDIQSALEKFGINQPNIFPVAALPTLQARSNDEFPEELDTFKKRIQRFPPMKLEQYYQFNHLPITVKRDIELWSKDKTVDEAIQIHAGIVSIEQAIRLYVEKYARPLKIKDLVQSFRNRLTSLNSFAELEKRVRESKVFKEELDKELSRVTKEYQNGKHAEDLAKEIKEKNLAKSVMEDVMKYIGQANNSIRAIRRKYGSGSGLLAKRDAIAKVKPIKEACLDSLSNLQVKVADALQEGHRELYEAIVEDFKKSLDSLSIKIDDMDFDFHPVDVVAEEISDLENIVNQKSIRRDVGNKERTKQNKNKKWYKPWTWFDPSELPDPETRLEDFVNMEDVLDDFLTPLQVQIVEAERSVKTHIQNESKRIKDDLIEKITEISKLVTERYSQITSLNRDKDETADQIKIQEENLEWLKSIAARVDNLIEY
ncbi:MAG: dynamin family protein [Muribaculaceae bacterium]|nr:dynamin family protein [Muribaculaceae bacterium]